MKNNWYDDENLWRNYSDERSKPKSLGEAFGYEGIKLSNNLLLKQFLGSVFLLAVFLFVFISSNPILLSAQDSLRYLLASKESDWTPTMQKMVMNGIWDDSVDRQVFNSTEKMIIPVQGKLGLKYGWQESKTGSQKYFHSGIDIITEPLAPIRAALTGTVVKIEESKGTYKLFLQHSLSLTTTYTLLSQVDVKKDQTVNQGDIVGKSTEVKDGIGKIHFEVLRDGKAVDPLEEIANSESDI